MRVWDRITGLFGAMIVAVVLSMSASALADEPTNPPISVRAEKEDNPQNNPDDIEGRFTQAPNEFKDEIHVINDDVEGKSAGVYNDPVNDGALLTITETEPHQPVIVIVEGRDGIGAIYYVVVRDKSPGSGGTGGGEALKWADVQDWETAGALVLKDTISGRGKSDKTNTYDDTPTLYCSTEDGKGKVEFWLIADSGSYNWTIKQGSNSIANGTLSTTNDWKASRGNLDPGLYQLEVTRSGDANFKRRVDFTVYGVAITSIDPHFAPSVERLDIQYSILPDGLTVATAKLEVFKKGDADSAIYSDDSIPKTGTGIVYKQGETEGWDGKNSSGDWISPVNSEYTAKITVSMGDGHGAESDTDTTQVLVESLTFNHDDPTRIIMNDPANQEEITVTVKLKKKDGTGAVTAVPIHVHFSFSDPDPANTARNDSHEYTPGNFLGKRNDADAVHWADHAKSDSNSTDGYKLVCRGRTVTDAGDDQGKAFIWFRPSGVGGDDFKLKAVVKHTDDSELKSEESGVLTVWRKVRFENIYEMDGETHVSTNATVAKIQPYFEPAFVEYEVGDVNAIPAAKSVKYIGLWKNDGDHQHDWAVIQAKLPAEEPTAAELAAADDPEHPDHEAARDAITAKAQAWTDRIHASFMSSLGQWRNNAGIPPYSAIAIKHMHPKYSPDGGDQVTNEWPNWVRITVPAIPNLEADPDGLWTHLGGVALGGTHAAIPKGLSEANVKRAAAHEAAHISRFGPPNNFHRQLFGPGDHSEQEGLMEPQPAPIVNEFSPDELKILRGMRVES